MIVCGVICTDARNIGVGVGAIEGYSSTMHIGESPSSGVMSGPPVEVHNSVRDGYGRQRAPQVFGYASERVIRRR